MLIALAEGVWVGSGPVSIVGMPLTSTMTVLRLSDGGLLLHSPVEATPARQAEVAALGEVRHVVAPNTFHHLWVGGWLTAYPDAKVHAPAGLAPKRPDLRIDSRAPVDAALVPIPIDGFRLEETAFVHTPSRTLVVTDLFHNIGRPPQRWTKIYAGLNGFYGKVALSRMLRLAAFSDRRAARRSVDRVAEQSFDRIVVGHGSPITESAAEVFDDATAWMPTGGLALPSGGSALVAPRPCG